jgi:hypothetical protein
VYECGYRRDLELDIGFIDHFNTQLVITLIYSAITDLRTLKITVTHLCSKSVTIRFLVTASNGEDSSASALTSSLNGGSLPTKL